MQNPVSVIKGEIIVKDIYLTDLEAWQSEGYEIYDPSVPQVKGSESSAPKRKATKSTPVESEQS